MAQVIVKFHIQKNLLEYIVISEVRLSRKNIHTHFQNCLLNIVLIIVDYLFIKKFNNDI